jgi:lipoprotein-releasing system permease protein
MNITPFFLAKRILLAHVYQKSISTMTIVCLSGIFIGSFSLALITAIMNGFEVTIHEKMQGIHANLIMQSYDDSIDIDVLGPVLTKEFPEIAAFSPLATHHILLRSKNTEDNTPCVALLRGIEPNAEQITSSIAEKIIKTAHTTLPFSQLFAGDSVVIGKQLALNNDIATGDTIELLFIHNEQIRGRKITLESHTATVSGIFDTGIDEFDNGVAYCSLSFLEKLFPNITIEHINIALKTGTNEEAIIERLHNRTGLDVYSWKSLYPALVATLKLEKYVSFFIIALILLVASMNIISLLFMQITQKRPDIALLKAIGMTDNAISAIFFIMGMTISCVASACGLAAALVASWALERYPFITLPDTYYVTQLPVAMTWQIICVVFCVVIIFSFLATWIPTKRIRLINISQVLRFEG